MASKRDANVHFHLTSTDDLTAWGGNELCIWADTQKATFWLRTSFLQTITPPPHLFFSFFFSTICTTNAIVAETALSWVKGYDCTGCPNPPGTMKSPHSLHPARNRHETQHLQQFTEEAEELWRTKWYFLTQVWWKTPESQSINSLNSNILYCQQNIDEKHRGICFSLS